MEGGDGGKCENREIVPERNIQNIRIYHNNRAKNISQNIQNFTKLFT